MTKSSSGPSVVVTPVVSVSLSSDLYHARGDRSQDLHPFLSVTQRAGQLNFAIACVGSRHDSSSPSRVLLLGKTLDAVDLKLEEHDELRRLYDVFVPLDEIQELEWIRIIEIRGSPRPKKNNELRSAATDEAEAEGLLTEQKEQRSSDFTDEFESSELLLKLPPSKYRRDR